MLTLNRPQRTPTMSVHAMAIRASSAPDARKADTGERERAGACERAVLDGDRALHRRALACPPPARGPSPSRIRQPASRSARSPTRRPRTRWPRSRAADEAQAAWGATEAPRERSDILRRAFEGLIVKRTDELAMLIGTRDGQGARRGARRGRLRQRLPARFEEAVRIRGSYGISPNGAARGLTMRRPVGPCLLITPWNFPLAMGTRKIGPAIAAGCTMVVKPAKQTPLSMLALGDAIFTEAGSPPAC